MLDTNNDAQPQAAAQQQRSLRLKSNRLAWWSRRVLGMSAVAAVAVLASVVQHWCRLWPSSEMDNVVAVLVSFGIWASLHLAHLWLRAAAARALAQALLLATRWPLYEPDYCPNDDADVADYA